MCWLHDRKMVTMTTSTPYRYATEYPGYVYDWIEGRWWLKYSPSWDPKVYNPPQFDTSIQCIVMSFPEGFSAFPIQEQFRRMAQHFHHLVTYVYFRAETHVLEIWGHSLFKMQQFQQYVEQHVQGIIEGNRRCFVRSVDTPTLTPLFLLQKK